MPYPHRHQKDFARAFQWTFQIAFSRTFTFALDTMRLPDALEQFLVAKQGQKRKPRTIESYRDLLTRFINWVQTYQPDDRVKAVTPAVIDGFMAHEAKHLSEITLHGRYRALNVFFNWMASRSDLKPHLNRRRNPVSEVEPPNVPATEQRAATVEQWKALLDAIECDSWLGARDYLMVTTFFLCGVRVSELIQLEIEDYDVAGEVLRIRRGKCNDYELIPMHEQVSRAFVAYLFVRPAWPTNEVFLAADGSWHNPDGVLTRSAYGNALPASAAAQASSTSTPTPSATGSPSTCSTKKRRIWPSFSGSCATGASLPHRKSMHGGRLRGWCVSTKKSWATSRTSNRISPSSWFNAR
jgi:site-specific recombinase XerD